jgi:hypothetical protein
MTIMLTACILLYLGIAPTTSADEPPERPPTPVRPDAPPRATPALPQQPTSQAVLMNTSASGSSDAYIELRGLDTAHDLLSVVQWQGRAGEWFDVEGWRSPVGPPWSVRWWVARKDRLTGPFRWKIYRLMPQRHEDIWSSCPFYLPSDNHTLVTSYSQSPMPVCPFFELEK